MKIAFIVGGFPSLSQTFVLNQITGLLDRGQEVDIYATKPEEQPVIHAEVEKYNLLDRTFYRANIWQTIPANKFLRLVKALRFIMTTPNKKIIPLLNAFNVFKFGKKATSLNVFGRTMPFLDKDMDKYDIVHCHFGPNGDLAVLLKDIGAVKGKVITTFHGHDISQYLKHRGGNVYDYLFDKGDICLAISERWKNELIRLGCSQEKIVRHNSGGIDTTKVAFVPRKLRDDGTVRLLTVGRLVEKKGVEYGIRAVAKVLQQYFKIEYKIAGDGPLKDELQNLIDNLHMTEKIELLGWKRQAEIETLMKEADIFLAPSVTSQDGDQEGAPAVIVEALAHGLPLISTWHSGIPELVQDGKSGFLVPERDVEALAEKLEYLITHPELWPEMGQAGRDYIEKNYDINKLNDRLVQLYQLFLQEGDAFDLAA